MEINGEIWTKNMTKKHNTTSKYHGVHYNNNLRLKKHWIATGKSRTKYVILGYFKTENEAALAYNQYIIDNKLEQFFPLNVIEY